MSKQSQHLNPQQVAKLLTRGTEHMDGQILSALGRSRVLALQKQRQTAPVFTLSVIGHRAHNLIPHTTQQWVATAILMAAIIVGGIGYLQNDQTPEDIDILTDELPIEVFVDPSNE